MAYLRKLGVFGGVALVLSGISGCASTFHEHFYFASAAAKGQQPNYYRVEVNGAVFLSSSRFLAGFFDEKAVNTYFDEFVQPANGQFDGTSTPPGGADGATNGGGAGGTSGATAGTSGAVAGSPNGSTPETGGTNNAPAPAATGKGAGTADAITPLTLSGAPVNGSLVLLLSSNSDAIASSISSLAQSDAMTDSLGGIINHNELQKSQKAVGQQAADQQSGTALKTMGTSVLGELTGTNPPQPTEAQQRLLAYANRLAAFIEPGTHFDSLAKAADWVSENSARLQRSQQ